MICSFSLRYMKDGTKVNNNSDDTSPLKDIPDSMRSQMGQRHLNEV